MAVDEMLHAQEAEPKFDADEIDPTFIPAPLPNLVAREVDGELVIVDEETGGLQHLDQIGAIVWGLLDGVTSIEDTAAELSEAFGADREVVRADVLELARQLGRAGLLEGVAAFQPQPSGGPQGLPEGSEVELPTLATLDGGTFDVASMRGRRYILVNWSPACGYCVRIADELTEHYPKLREADVDLVLLCASDRERNAAMAEERAFPFLSVLREGAEIDSDPFPQMGTPSAYLVDEEGRTSGPALVGALLVPELVRDLAGVEDDHAGHDHAEHEEGEPGTAPKFLPEGGGACAPGATPVEYAASSTFEIGEWHIGIKSTTVEADAIVRALLAPNLSEEISAPGNFAVTLQGGPRTAQRSVNLLSRGSEVLVRSNNPARVLYGLLQFLTPIAEAQDDPEMMRTGYAPLVGSDGGVLLVAPSFVQAASAKKVQPYLHRAGARFADLPFATLDLATKEVVVPEPVVAYDPSVLESVEIPPSATEPARVLPGRYPLKGWLVRSGGEEIAAEPRPRAVANVLPYVDTLTFGMARALDSLTDLFAEIPTHAAPMGKPKEIAKALIELLGR